MYFYTVLIFILTSIFFSFERDYDAVVRTQIISSDSLLFPKAKHREQSKLIHQLLTKYHYKKISLNDSLSEKVLDKYISSLDPNREYLYSSDINYFKQYERQMDDYITSGYLEPAYEIFTVYHERVKNRIDFVFSMLKNEPDFSQVEDFYLDRKESEWFDDVEQMDDYWRKKIKNAVLNLKILGKDWDSNKETLEN